MTKTSQRKTIPQHSSQRSHAGRHRHPVPWLGLALAVGWLLYLVAARLLLGPEVAWKSQKLLGFGSALLALAVYWLLTRKVVATEEMLERLRLAEQSGFGKRLVHQHTPPKTVPLPFVGKIRVRTLGGIVVFLAVACWWNTPWAPIHVKKSPTPPTNSTSKNLSPRILDKTLLTEEIPRRKIKELAVQKRQNTAPMAVICGRTR